MEVPNIDQQIKESFDEFSMFHSDNIDLINSNKDEDAQSVPLNKNHILKDAIYSEEAEKTKNIIFTESDEEIIDIEEFKSEADMENLKPCSSLATWVQCDQEHCQKWRLIENEPLPEESHKWECCMSKNSCRNKCEFSQETMPSDNEETLHTSFLPGDLVLGKMPGYPWWPGIIEDDPDFESFFDCQIRGDKEVISFHVTFFGKEASRAWLQKTSIANFDGHEKLEDLGPLSYQGKSFRKKVLEALKEATKALDMTNEKRLRKYAFMTRHKEGNAKIRSKSKEKKESITIKEKKESITVKVVKEKKESIPIQEVQKKKDNSEKLTPSQEHAEKMIEKYVTAEMLVAFKSNYNNESINVSEKKKAPFKSKKRKNQINESVICNESDVSKKLKITKNCVVKKISSKKKLNEQNLDCLTGSAVTQVLNDEKAFIVQNDVSVTNSKKRKKKEKQIINTANQIKLKKTVGEKRKKVETQNLSEKKNCGNMESKIEQKPITDVKKSSKVSCKAKVETFQNVKKFKIVKKLDESELIKESNELVIDRKHSDEIEKPITEACIAKVPPTIEINVKPLLDDQDMPNNKSLDSCGENSFIKEVSKSDPHKKKILDTEKIPRIQNIPAINSDNDFKNETRITSPTNNKIGHKSTQIVSCQLKPTFIKKGIPSKKSVFKAPVKSEVANLTPSNNVSITSFKTKPLSCSSNVASEILQRVAENESSSLVLNKEDEGDVDIGLEMNLSLQLDDVSSVLPSSSPEF
ncbi:lens epithelium-derived growth factor isoform X2 [Hydra vulgaris]|uniref:lens epithelium-derived growth factor isoform X2 n=1 Tax=Hydra vulgaris TaxID=6087 RepID=UPI0032EA8F75